MMAEKKVPYEVDGRQFEGMIVYDDSVKTKRPGHFRAARLEGRLCRHDREGAHRRRPGLRDADGRHVRQRLRRHAQDPRTARRRHARRLQGPLVHDCLRQQGLRRAPRRGEQARSRRPGEEDGGDRLLRRWRLRARAGARRSRFQGGGRVPRHQPQPGRAGHALQHQGPGAGGPRRGRSGHAQVR